MNAAVFEETVRRHLVSAGYIAFLLLIVTTGLLAATFHKPASLWPTLVTLLAIITGSALIGPELSTGALQLIVTKPVRRPVYLLSRVAGVFAAVCVAAAAGVCAEGVARLASGAEAMPWRELAEALGGALLESFLAIALLTLLGSVTRAYFNAAIYVTTQIVLSLAESLLGVARARGRAVGQYLEHHPAIERGLAGVSDFLFPDAPPELHWLWVLRLLATAAIALLLACLAFGRREVPYGSD
jgi:ABC-type transport system involved in multi-copper enzyme maturation permease subunit